MKPRHRPLPRRRRLPRHILSMAAVSLSVLTTGALLTGVLWPASSGPVPVAATGVRPAEPDVEPVPQVISWVPTSEKLIALTFDAGSDAGHTLAILDILAGQSVQSTFFLTGAWLDNCPDMARAVAAQGHELGNHSDSHPYMTGLSDQEATDEILVTEDKALQVLGQTLRPYFRPPYGDFDRRIARVAAEAGYPYFVMWTVDSLDWQMISPEDLTDRVMAASRPGAIVLMHVGSQTRTPEALPEIIRRLKHDGYRLVTIGDLLEAWPEGVVLHTVSAGETLSAIALQYGVPMSDIVAANGLENPNLVRAGTGLLIPSPADPGDGVGDGGYGDPHPGDTSGSGGEVTPGPPEDMPPDRPGLWERVWNGVQSTWDRLRGAAGHLWRLIVGR